MPLPQRAQPEGVRVPEAVRLQAPAVAIAARRAKRRRARAYGSRAAEAKSELGALKVVLESSEPVSSI